MKINRLYIKDFGLIKEMEIFPESINILSGDNGNGKSTVSQVIHYIFSNETQGNIKDCVRWGKSNFNIQCEFEHNGIEYNYDITGGSTVKKELSVQGQVYRNSEATKYLSEIFNPKLMAYSNFALQHENTNILFEKPTERLGNIKRLLGMESIGKAVDLLKSQVKNLKSEYEKLDAKRNSLESFEFSYQDLPSPVSFDSSDEIIQLKNTKLEYQNYIKEKDKYQELLSKRNSYVSRIEELEKEIKSIRVERMRFDLEGYNSKLTEYQELKSEIDEQNVSIRKIEFLKNRMDECKGYISNYQSKLESFVIPENELENLKKKESLLSESKYKLKDLKHKLELGESGKCPTCEQDYCIDIESYKKEISVLDKEIISLEKEITSLQKQVKEYETKTKEFESLKKDIESEEVSLGKLQKELSELPEIDSSLEEKLNAISQEISLLEKDKKEFERITTINEENLKRKKELNCKLEDCKDSLPIVESDLSKYDIIEVTWDESQEKRLQELENLKVEYETYLKLKESAEKFNKDIENKKREHEETLKEISSELESIDYKIGIKSESLKILDKQFSSHLIDKGTSLIQHKMNEYFSKAYGKYNILIKGDGNSVDFLYTEDGSKIAPVIRAGGQEKNVFSMAFRIAINSLQSTNFFLGDEIDSDASEENSISMIESFLSENYEQIWLVSHKNSTKEHLSNNYNAKIFTLKDGKVF